jgi:hypothetical protein
LPGLDIRAERRAGELLGESEKNPGQLFRGNMMLQREEIPTLSELGINRIQSVRWQKIAAMPEAKLYRPYGTFEEYCRKRWDMSRFYAHRLIDAAEARENLLPIGNIPPANESQVRPLTRLEPELQREAWEKAVDTAPEGKITARHVEKVVRKILKKLARNLKKNTKKPANP